MNDIHAAAERLAAEFLGLGRAVTVSHSTNRNGDVSSYLEVSGLRTRLRVSDHFSATTDAVDVSCEATAEQILADAKTAEDAARVRKASEDAARDAREAPHKAAWLATDKQHERGEIIARLYPNAGRMDRQQVAARWSRG